jgi:hypothetical protein
MLKQRVDICSKSTGSVLFSKLGFDTIETAKEYIEEVELHNNTIGVTAECYYYKVTAYIE